MSLLRPPPILPTKPPGVVPGERRITYESLLNKPGTPGTTGTPFTFPLSAIPGQTSTTRKFLRSVGTGTVAGTPTWDTLTAADVGPGTFPAGGFVFPSAGNTLGMTTLANTTTFFNVTVDSGGTPKTVILGSDPAAGGSGFVGTLTNHPFVIRANNVAAITIAASGAVSMPGALTAASFVGPLTGNVTGNVSGSAATATTATNQSGGSVNATTGAFSGNLSYSAFLLGAGGITNSLGAGDVGLGNLKGIRGANAAGTANLWLIGLDGANKVNIDANATGSVFGGAVTLGGALRLSNAFVAGAVAATGTIKITDSTGTVYRVSCAI